MPALLAEHDGRCNKDEARSMLRKEFTERLDRIDITLVLDTLMDDYGDCPDRRSLDSVGI